MIYTTLNKIRERSPCESGWVTLLKHLGKTKADDELLGFDAILNSNGLDDALWCLRTLEDDNQVSRPFALWCARQVENNTQDPRVKACNDVNERFINGDATRAELEAASDASRVSAWSAARTVNESAWSAASFSANDAAWAASDAARAAARAAVAVAGVAGAASDAARAAAMAAVAVAGVAGAASVAAQKTEFLRLINSIEG